MPLIFFSSLKSTHCLTVHHDAFWFISNSCIYVENFVSKAIVIASDFQIWSFSLYSVKSILEYFLKKRLHLVECDFTLSLHAFLVWYYQGTQHRFYLTNNSLSVLSFENSPPSTHFDKQRAFTELLEWFASQGLFAFFILFAKLVTVRIPQLVSCILRLQLVMKKNLLPSPDSNMIKVIIIAYVIELHVLFLSMVSLPPSCKSICIKCMHQLRWQSFLQLDCWISISFVSHIRFFYLFREKKMHQKTATILEKARWSMG